VRDIGIAQATYARVFFVALTLTAALATAIVYGFGGVAAVHGALAVGTVVALTQYLTRLYGPLTQLSNLNLDVMTALVSFERLFEVLDIVPMIEEDPDAVDVPGAGLHRVRTRRLHLPGAEEVSLASLESVAVLESGPATRCSTTCPSASSPARWWPWSGRRAPARRPSRPGAPPLRRHRGHGALERHRRAPCHHGSRCATWWAW
jgi:ABC-type multidrug transport system fused ATPase/permease subunit